VIRQIEEIFGATSSFKDSIFEILVVNNRLANDVLAALIKGFIRKGKATIKQEIDTSGFYIVNGKLIAVGYEVKEPSKEELRQAL
jgi:hypothetical protein